MRLFLMLAATLLSAAAGLAQTQAIPEPSTYGSQPARERILAWLHSSDPRLQAWAAHDILKYHSADLIPELEARLENTTDAARLANFRSTVAMLDTLIQLGATVPAKTLGRIEKLGYNVQPEELILLSRLPWDQAESAIGSFYQPSVSGHSGETRVAAQLLARNRAKGFAAEVLSSIVVTGRVVVHDANRLEGGASGWSGDCAGGPAAVPNDWPETGRYSFQDPPADSKAPLSENGTLFLAAPDPIYVVRTVSRTYYANTCGGFSPLDDAIRSHLVGTLLHGSPASPFPERIVTVDIQFQSREAYRAKVQAFVDEQQQNFDRVASTLTALNLLSEQERQAAALRINLILQDDRSQPAEELPTIAFRPPVQWIADR